MNQGINVTQTSRFTPQRLGFAVITVAFIAGITVFGGGYFVYLLNLVGIFALVAIGLNVLTGSSGQISLGHAGFFAIGAYAAALLSSKFGVPFWLAIPIASILTTFIGALIALPALRLKNLYLAIATLGFGIVAQKMIFEWREVTGGGAGLEVPIPFFFGISLADGSRMTWVIAAVLAVATVAAYRIVNGRTGRALTMLSESELAAGCLGIDVARYKVIAFAVSAFYTAVAGGLYANLVRYINPESFNVNMSIMFLAMIVIGGMGSVRGAILGAAFYVLMPEAVRGFKDAPGLIFGLSLMLVVILLPGGLTSLFKARQKKVAT
ncbi:branched-chain amino acid ABC transporter permease [Pollutimonas thiosulfatoxidans]|uniref:Branched-chain amino acid ABC transporter permease n=1 Tax=Pollutimonas thiosulfatoxidans TaxID=2028345 RepID=A0A410GE86_9BURK|nr:branched-chain amino acid ABC transporter permease [Pollutimonas thiosulfatoxidans]